MKLKKFDGNPILKPNPDNGWEDFAVLNPAVIYDEKMQKFVMLYRAVGDEYQHRIRFGLATSRDGYNFQRCSNVPVMDARDNDPDEAGLEDARAVNIDGRYYITYASRPFWAGRYWLTREERIKQGVIYHTHPDSAPTYLKENLTVSYLAYTDDWKTYKRLGKITDTRYDDRDVIIFPERINGMFVKLSRPVREHGPRAMWISFSDTIMEWGEPQVLYIGEEWWEKGRLGGSCPPIRTKDGWLLVYHGVDEEEMIYRTGFMLLDLNDPTKILAKTKNFVMEPEYDYETKGIYNGCVFPTGIVEREGLLYIYYGSADKYVSLATVPLDEVLAELKLNLYSKK